MSRIACLVVLAACASGPSPAPAPAAPHSFAVTVTGSGPPLILIPGLASSGETWTSTVEHLRTRYTCHVLTLAGFAGVPAISEPLVPAVRAELARYITAHGLAKPIVVGHSLGGALALAFAAEQPALVGPIVIVDALPFLAATMGVGSVDEARPMLDGIRGMMTGQTQAQYEAFVRAGTQTRGMVRSDEDHARIVQWGLASDRKTVGSAMLDLLGTDLRPVLPRITAPALVVGTWVGWGDRESTLAVYRAQYEGLAHMHFAVSETARHFVMFDEPAWWLGELDRFLADPDGTVRDRSL